MSSTETKIVESDTETAASAREKVCKVCGDKALGYNFNAITCESCKAFFRRNALKNKEFKCPFNKKCDINPVTRRFCQLCRLIKCFEIGMRKEYIMSEDDKREKRKKTEKNRATRKRPIENDECSLQTPNKKQTNVEDEKDDVDGLGKKLNYRPVKINLLNMASTSTKTYQKKQVKANAGSEQLVPFPSPGLPECFSPETVTESRTCNVFNESNNPSDSSQSRSVEIYQISKSKEGNKPVELQTSNLLDSNIIKIILDSEFSKPSEVYTNSTVSWQSEEDKLCNFREKVREDDYIIRESDILDLAKNNRNFVLESTQDGKRFLVISKEPVFKRDSPEELNRMNSEEVKKMEEWNREKTIRNESSTPLLSSLIDSDKTSERNRSSSSKNIEDIFQDIPRSSTLCLTNSIDSILSEAIKLEYEAYTSMNTRMNSRELNDAERAKLNELIVANKALLAPLEDDLSGDDFGFNAIAGCGPSVLVDVLNLTAVAIRRLIKMSKKINAFKNMCQDDQIALLKGGCTEMMILRSAMTYDPDRDSWKIPQSKEKLMNIKVDILKEAGGRVFEEHQRFLQTFDPKWRNDENIMLILSAIAMFTPDRPRVVHHDVIKLEQNSYYYLLRRYLESVYQGCEARLIFLKLIHKISELHKLNEDHVRVYLDANPREIEPLLIEIFDLKPH